MQQKRVDSALMSDGESRAAKRAYQRPEVKSLGRVDELTLAGGPSQSNDTLHVSTKAAGT